MIRSRAVLSRRTLLFAATLLPATAFGQENASPPAAPTHLTAAQLKADFVIFKRAYQELHPGLYRYNTPEQMEANFRELEQQLSHDQTLPEAYLAFAAFLNKIKCGHCYPNFYNQPKAIVQELFKNQDRVPFYFRWLDRRMIITRNFSNDARLVPGTEVLALNGVPAKTVLAKLMTVSRADGNNDDKRISNLEVQGANQYEAFDIYYPCFYPVKDRTFSLLVRSPQGIQQTLPVTALTYEQRIAPYKTEIDALKSDQPLWEFRSLDTKTAYLRMPTWAVYDSKWDWKGFIDRSFAEMAQKQTKNLIIDLRGNEGGADVGNVLISKFIKQDLRSPQQLQRWVRYQKVPEDLKPYLDTWDFSFLDWGKSVGEFKDGFARMTKFDDDAEGDVIKATAQPFTGKTYVLIDASNSSATFQFAKAVKENKLATLVGQPTGGSQRGINGGAFFFLKLPNSKIETDIPLVGAYPTGVHPSITAPVKMSQPDAGMTPDTIIRPRIEDIAQGIDTELTTLQKRLQ
jgi:hypothetical protein